MRDLPTGSRQGKFIQVQILSLFTPPYAVSAHIQGTIQVRPFREKPCLLPWEDSNSNSTLSPNSSRKIRFVSQPHTDMSLQFKTYIFKTVTLHLLHGHDVQMLIQKKELLHTPVSLAYLLFPVAGIKSLCHPCWFPWVQEIELGFVLVGQKLDCLSSPSPPHNTPYFLRKGFT